MNKPTIQDKIVPINLAVILKSKGFDWKIAEFYIYTPPLSSINSSGGYKQHYRSHVAYSNTEWQQMDKDAKKAFWKGIDERHPNVSAPTYSMVIDWLLEKGYYVNAVLVNNNGKDNWTYSYIKLGEGEEYLGRLQSSFTDRYEALNKGILNVLKKL